MRGFPSGLYRYLVRALCCLALLLGSCVNEKEEPVSSVTTGQRCPSFSVRLTDGTTVTTADLAGHTTLLLFFDTACPDCRALLPVVQQVYDAITLPADQLQSGKDESQEGSPLVLAISREEPAPQVADYWTANSLTIPVSPQPDRTVYNLFATSIIPRIYIIAPDLTITRTYVDSPLPTVQQLLSDLGGNRSKKDRS